MDSLPVELLSKIFINVLPPTLDDVRHPVDDPTQAQAALSGVCQRWNQIAEWTPELWTFIILSTRSSSHYAMKRRLGLSGSLPLNVSMRLSRQRFGQAYLAHLKPSDDQSSYEMHTLLVEQVLRWKTLRIQANILAFSDLRHWIPSELPNAIELSLSVEVTGYFFEDHPGQNEPFISAPRLTICVSNSPEYHAAGIGFWEPINPTLSSMWRGLVARLSEKCRGLEVLQVATHSSKIRPSFHDRIQGHWPDLPSLTTLRFASGATSSDVGCLLAELKAPQLHRVEFRGHIPFYPLYERTGFPVEKDCRVMFSTMPTICVEELLRRIPNAKDMQVELDLDSIIYEDPRLETAVTREFQNSVTATTHLREWWGWIRENIPEVSWIVPSDEGEGSWKRLGGADLSLDDAIAYLDHRREARFKT
ncbi:hypothetical protein FRC01_005042 [Tulasnella sp. 417]|nr:hypothetical protein FRC01_005042 [Tulasnella sp. 417]